MPRTNPNPSRHRVRAPRRRAIAGVSSYPRPIARAGTCASTSSTAPLSHASRDAVVSSKSSIHRTGIARPRRRFRRRRASSDLAVTAIATVVSLRIVPTRFPSLPCLVASPRSKSLTRYRAASPLPSSSIPVTALRRTAVLWSLARVLWVPLRPSPFPCPASHYRAGARRRRHAAARARACRAPSKPASGPGQPRGPSCSGLVPLLGTLAGCT